MSLYLSRSTGRAKRGFEPPLFKLQICVSIGFQARRDVERVNVFVVGRRSKSLPPITRPAVSLCRHPATEG